VLKQWRTRAEQWTRRRRRPGRSGTGTTSAGGSAQRGGDLRVKGGAAALIGDARAVRTGKGSAGRQGNPMSCLETSLKTMKINTDTDHEEQNVLEYYKDRPLNTDDLIEIFCDYILSIDDPTQLE
jgi:hypothetical protein